MAKIKVNFELTVLPASKAYELGRSLERALHQWAVSNGVYDLDSEDAVTINNTITE